MGPGIWHHALPPPLLAGVGQGPLPSHAVLCPRGQHQEADKSRAAQPLLSDRAGLGRKKCFLTLRTCRGHCRATCAWDNASLLESHWTSKGQPRPSDLASWGTRSSVSWHWLQVTQGSRALRGFGGRQPTKDAGKDLSSAESPRPGKAQVPETHSTLGCSSAVATPSGAGRPEVGTPDSLPL